MKLYTNGVTDVRSSGLVKLTASLLGVEYTEVDVSKLAVPPQPTGKKADKGAQPVDPAEALRSKSLTGKFPLLETPEGFTIFEASSIAKYFARKSRGFYGNNDFESKISFRYS